MSGTLAVNEIYLSLQGESTFAGLPCVFVRLTACNLRCSYCDTAYAFKEGQAMALDDVLRRVRELAEPYTRHSGRQRLPLVELTGGEPLLQKTALPLMAALCDDHFTVLLETSGAIDISPVDARVHRIMDIKCPGSGEVERNHWDNLKHLRTTDEIKFVICTTEDYDWARYILDRHQLNRICPVLFSWASPLQPHQRDPSLKLFPPGQHPITLRELAEQIARDAIPVRFQLQLHKVIWPPDQRRV